MREPRRADLLALSNVRCEACHGSGLAVRGTRSRISVCQCVSRAVFRICYARLRDCMANVGIATSRALRSPGPRRLGPWGRQNEEYIADFDLISRSCLDEKDYSILREHFYLGIDVKKIIQKQRLVRGEGYYAIGRIEDACGAAFMLTEPYGLYPLDEYFHASRQGRAVCNDNEWPARMTRYDRRPIIAPLAKRGKT